MTSGTPWSVKGIDPKAREVAKDLARRSGMTLGEWLNHMILEDESPEDVFSEAQVTSRVGRQYMETPRDHDSAPPRYETADHPADEIGRVVRALEGLTAHIEISETHTGLAIGGVEHSVREAIARIEAAEREQVAVAARFEGAVAEVSDGQARISERLRRIETEAAGPRSAEALRALEQALGKVANHLYDGEGRTRALLDAVEARVAGIENGGGASDAGAIVEEVVSRIGERLAQSEARTAQSLQALRDTFAALDNRLNAVERDGAPALGQKFEHLAADLTQRVEASRVDLAAQLRASADGRFDRIERTLGEVAGQVRAAEQGSAQAIERMGREVRGMAETLNQRVQAVEHRSADAIEQVGGEMARIAQAMETRLGRTDTVHAQALEKLGGEITRITERLAERISASERRSAQAIDDVLEQVSRSAERTGQRQDRVSDEISERIRQSEERTARILDEARARIDQGLSETNRRLEEVGRLAPAAAVAAAAPVGLDAFARLGPAEPDPLAETFEAPTISRPLAETPADPVDEVEAEAFPAPTFKAFADDAPFPEAAAPAEAPAFDVEDFEAAEGFSPIPEADADDFARELMGREVHEPEAAAVPPPPPILSSPLEILEAARARAMAPPSAPEPVEAEPSRDEAFAPFEPAATPFEPEPAAFTGASEPEPAPAEEQAQAASAPEPHDSLEALEALEAQARDTSFEIKTDGFGAPAAAAPEAARPLSTREVIEQARAAARAASPGPDGKRPKTKSEKDGGGLFSGFGVRPKRRAGSTLQVALMLAGGAAAVGLATAGYVLDGAPGGETPKRVADALDDGAAPDPLVSPRAAVALSPTPLAGEATPQADPSLDLPGLYAEALNAVQAKAPGAVVQMQKVANLGYPRAQFYLAKLYENGESGLKKDLGEARRWTERAARGGEREAMHNFALQQFFGDGGPKDPVGAAQWFRRAADLGLVDSQYNLARLYEDGVGVNRNGAEAYKWYLIAARSGDPDSKASAERVKAKLSPDARAVTERAALSFRPAVAGAAPQAAGSSGDAPVQSVAVAQRALSRLGYYQGPSDGTFSPATRLAIAAYQRDQEMPATGALDQTTLARLEVFTR